jgi:hypothetical protein
VKKVSANIDKLIKSHNFLEKIYTTKKRPNFFKDYFKDPFKVRRNTKCKIENNVLPIMNKGDIVFCHDLEPLGNIREKDVIDILFNPKTLGAKRKMLDCTQVCEFHVNCFFEG